MIHRRYRVFFLLLLFNLIYYVDRINVPIAGRSIAEASPRWPVVVTGAISLVWVAVWRLLVSTPDDTARA